MPDPLLLVVAGHDPSGGAGVLADQEAGERFGARVCSVVSAWTEQDEGGVHGLAPRAPAEWAAEAVALLADAPRAWKFGLLPGADHVRAAARLVGSVAGSLPTVLDPVLRASDGTLFLDAEGVEALRQEFLPLAPIITPNVPELAHLVGADRSAADELATDPAARLAAAEKLLELGAQAVLAKGGHATEDPVSDLVLVRGADPVWVRHPRVRGGSIRGSGCRYASAVAAGLANGQTLPEAARAAGRWVAELIAKKAPAAR